MALQLVIGYGRKGSDAEAEVLFFGEDGEKARAVLDEPNEKFPRRELIFRPMPVKRRTDPTKEEIEAGRKQIADEAAAAAAALEVLPEVDAQDAIDFLTAERDALAAKVKQLEDDSRGDAEARRKAEEDSADGNDGSDVNDAPAPEAKAAKKK
jgi:hypothetical protein